MDENAWFHVIVQYFSELSSKMPFYTRCCSFCRVSEGSSLCLLGVKQTTPDAEAKGAGTQSRDRGYKSGTVPGWLGEAGAPWGHQTGHRWVELCERAVEQHLKALRSGKTSLMISPRHEEARKVAAIVRRQLKAQGAIGAEDHAVKVLRRLDLGPEACRDLLHYAPTDAWFRCSFPQQAV